MTCSGALAMLYSLLSDFFSSQEWTVPPPSAAAFSSTTGFKPSSWAASAPASPSVPKPRDDDIIGAARRGHPLNSLRRHTRSPLVARSLRRVPPSSRPTLVRIPCLDRWLKTYKTYMMAAFCATAAFSRACACRDRAQGGEIMTVSRRSLIAATALTALTASRVWSQTPQPESAPAASPRTALRTWFAGQFTGDFDAMLDRRLIRLVVPYSPTLFFEDKGTIYGTAANGAQLFEGWVNKTFALGPRPLTVPLTPVSRDKLFDRMLAGDGDIAAGDITITAELRKKVAFSEPVVRNVREIVITREEVPEFDSAEALSGKEVAVGRSTSYYESLAKLNEL